MTYRGFSFAQFDETRSFTTSGIDTVKRDLMNHLMTEKGTRLNMPNFGTCIPALMFENGTPEMIDQIKRDVKAVIDYDPRVRLLTDINVYFIADRHVIVVQFDLLYIELGIQQPFNIILPGK